MKKIIIFGFYIIILLAITFGIYLLKSAQSTKQKESTSQQTQSIITVKTYSDSQLHLIIQVPNNWQEEQNQTGEKGSFALLFSPSLQEKLNEVGPVGDPYSISIGYPDTVDTFSSLEKYSEWGTSSITSMYYITINGRKTLIVKLSSPETPPPSFQGQWCNSCSGEYIYIQVGPNTILPIRAYWQNDVTNFNTILNNAIETIHVTPS